jgi:hypothetical protein
MSASNSSTHEVKRREVKRREVKRKEERGKRREDTLQQTFLIPLSPFHFPLNLYFFVFILFN